MAKLQKRLAATETELAVARAEATDVQRHLASAEAELASSRTDCKQGSTMNSELQKRLAVTETENALQVESIRAERESN